MSKSPKEIRKFNFNRKQYDLSITILPQGDVMLLDNCVVSHGQKYLPGDTYSHFLMNRKHPELLYKIIDNKDDELLESLIYASNIVRNSTGINFSFSSVNIKPVLNESKRKLDLIITDLASSLVRSYNFNKEIIIHI
jgi:hypothetical protein